MAVSLNCEAAGCTVLKTAEDMPTCIALMQLHQKNVHDTRDTRQKPPKINPPTLQQGIGEDDWAAFTRWWEMFRNGTDLTPNQITAQLLACCEPELEAALFREMPTKASSPEAAVLDAMKRLTVVSVALSVRRAALLQMKQEPGEHVRQYVARLHGLANVCQWTKTGTCRVATCSGTIATDYTKDIVKLVLLTGLADDDIKKEVLGMTDIDTRTLNETVSLVDTKETAARAMATENLWVATSGYKKMVRGRCSQASPAPTEDHGEQAQMRHKIRCQCGSLTPQFGMVRGKLKEFTLCLGCWKKNNPRPHKSSPPSSSGLVEALFHYVATTEIGSCASGALPHPMLSLTVAVDGKAYDMVKTPCPPRQSVRILAITDSGAQTCLMGLRPLKKLGLCQRHLTRVSTRILAANNVEINVLGAVFLMLSSCNTQGEQLKTSAVVYVTDSTSQFYLS
nr:uncharacterized protein LOC128704271 [Cherax quadricarinatus]